MVSLVLYRWSMYTIRTNFKVRLLTGCDIPQDTIIATTVGDHDDRNEDEFIGSIPRDKVNIRYVRGSGPGGQNVNKLNTKAIVRFHVNNADWLSDRTKDRLNKLYKTKINKAGEIIATSHKYRTQTQNLADALLKLEEFIKVSSEVHKGSSELSIERVKILKRKQEWKRLKEKKYNSEKKNDRLYK